tara:strand:+ start:4258 stop:4506 length:249 start_codon:yes stop_codon:yes gene_type:complete
MKKVICINDKNLPPGAVVVKDKEYTVVNEYVNFLDQRVYILQGIVNEGRTKLGLEWTGFDAKRFADVDKVVNEKKEVNFALN